MANNNNPNGFKCLSASPDMLPDMLLGGPVSAGDLLARNGSGDAVIFVAGTHHEALGVAGAAGTSGTRIPVYALTNEFVAQAAGTYAKATHDCNRYDVAGATGVQYIDLAVSTYGHVMVIGHAPQPGSTGVGAYSKVRVRILKNAAGDTPYGYQGAAGVRAVARTMTGDETFDGTEVTIQYLSAGGSNRNLTLPAVAVGAGRWWLIKETAGANTITIKNAGGSTIKVCAAGQLAIVAVNAAGTDWA